VLVPPDFSVAVVLLGLLLIFVIRRESVAWWAKPVAYSTLITSFFILVNALFGNLLTNEHRFLILDGVVATTCILFVLSWPMESEASSPEVELLIILRQFALRFQQFSKDGLDRVLFIDIRNMQRYAFRLADELLQIEARSPEPLDSDIRTRVETVADKLHRFGVDRETDLTHRDWDEMRAILTEAYEVAQSVIPLLEKHRD
jgi:hypothetical protein